ncbi:MAG: Stage sporulation protein [Candidatus Saccharibacteria bacterium]|nr:Stage sporulation protein [Candidatus Saccharibacteria bacterium]
MQTLRARRRPSLAETEQRRHRPDYWLPLIATGLLGIGVVVVYAISPGVSTQNNVSEAYYITKQLVAVALGAIAFLVLSRVPIRWWRSAIKPLILASILTALAVQFFGARVNGAYRWVQIGGFSFQAAELIKFTLLIWLADLLARAKKAGKLDSWQDTLKPLAICLVAIAIVVGVMESDFGSTTVMVGMISAMVFVAGLPLKRIMMIGGTIAIGAILLISAIPYRRQRLLTFLHPAANCQTTGYQSCQALIAVGSGGMFGLGLGKSVQAYGYLPEASNDSIFAILSEKFGFIGMTLILAAYAVFFGRLAKIIEKAPDDFSGFLVTGMLAWFSVQAAINIGAMIGLLPLKGITLPFISTGGTSVLFVTGALGLAFQISRYSSYSISNNNQRSLNDDPTSGRGQRRTYYTTVRRRT